MDGLTLLLVALGVGALAFYAGRSMRGSDARRENEQRDGPAVTRMAERAQPPAGAPSDAEAPSGRMIDRNAAGQRGGIGMGTVAGVAAGAVAGSVLGSAIGGMAAGDAAEGSADAAGEPDATAAEPEVMEASADQDGGFFDDFDLDLDI